MRIARAIAVVVLLSVISLSQFASGEMKRAAEALPAQGVVSSPAAHLPSAQGGGDSIEAGIIRKIAEASFQSEERFQSALSLLAESSGALKARVAEAISREYAALPEGRADERWFLLWLLSEMKLISEPRALEVFQSILAKPITAAHAEGDLVISPYQNEVKIYLTCVDGLWRLARSGSQRAIVSLLGAIAHPEYAIRRAAVQAYLHLSSDGSAERDAARARVKKLLKPEEQFFVDIKWLKDPPIPPVKVPAAKDDGDAKGPAPSGEATPPPQVPRE